MTRASRRPPIPRLLALLALSALACACARRPPEGDRDPLIGCNRKMFAFNDGLDRWVMKPVANGYTRVTPAPVRRCVSHFFANLENIYTIPNQFLQAKPLLGLSDTGRLVTNTTVGVIGLFDVASHWGMPPHEEDFGQTFAVWRMPEGPYLVVPFIGPMTARDAPGRVVSAVFDLILFSGVNQVLVTGLGALETVDERADAGNDLNKVNEMAMDRYIFIREAYRSRREFLIHDGKPPADDLIEDFDLDAESPDAPPPSESAPEN